jgi:hypothetical protein
MFISPSGDGAGRLFGSESEAMSPFQWSAAVGGVRRREGQPVVHVVDSEEQLDQPINHLALWQAPPRLSHLAQFVVQVLVL